MPTYKRSPGQITRRSDRTWLVRIYLGIDPQTGKRKYFNRTVHGTKKDAERYLTAALAARDLGTFAEPSRVTMGNLFDDILRDYKVNGKRLDWAEILVERHLRPFFGNVRAAKLTSDLINRYIEQRQTSGIANSTINRELAIFRRSLNLGTETTPPKVITFPKVPSLDEPPARKGFFEHDEFLALRAELPAHLRPVITFAYYTGCRKGEILLLLWEQVDLAERIVRLNPGETKNDEGRIVPLDGELYTMIAFQRTLRDEKFPDCPWVFFRDGEPIKRTFWWSWDEACRRVGLWDAEKGKPSRVFHDLRRTGARNLVRAGVPERIVMAIGGWKTRSVFDRYNIVSERDIREAGRKLSDYLARKSAESENSHTIRTHSAHSGTDTKTRSVRKLLN